MVRRPARLAIGSFSRACQCDALLPVQAAESKVEFKKTWKKVGTGNYSLKTQVTGLGAPPPKKSVADLP